MELQIKLNLTIQFLLVQTFKEDITSLEDVQHFLESKGHLEVSFKVGSIVDTVVLSAL